MDKNNDEIDLYNIILFLWSGKWFIILFVFIGILSAFLFISLQKFKPVSKLVYTTNAIPPFYQADQALEDFEKNFFSDKFFNDWKNNNNNTLLSFNDFSLTKDVNGLLFSKDETEKLAKFYIEDKTLSAEGEVITANIAIESDELKLLNDFYNYSIFINDSLTFEYLLWANTELDMIENRLSNLSTTKNTNDTPLIQEALSIQRFIASIDNGKKVFVIERPTFPKVNVPNRTPIIIIFAILGATIAIFILFIRDSIITGNDKIKKIDKLISKEYK